MSLAKRIVRHTGINVPLILRTHTLTQTSIRKHRDTIDVCAASNIPTCIRFDIQFRPWRSRCPWCHPNLWCKRSLMLFSLKAKRSPSQGAAARWSSDMVKRVTGIDPVAGHSIRNFVDLREGKPWATSYAISVRQETLERD